MEDIRHKSREISQILTLDFSIKNAIKPFSGTSTLFLLLPAMLYCCSGSPEVHIPSPAICSTKVSLNADIRSMDVFVFKDDLLQKLDCYQRVDDMEEWNGSIVSGSGDRIISILANSPYDRQHWFTLKSRPHLESFPICLEDEVPEHAVMTGEVHAYANHDKAGYSEVRLTPLSSEIVLRSICCDFTGRAYAGAVLSDVRVYLTNVNAETMISCGSDRGPSRIINAGGYNESDAEAFRCKEIIMQEVTGEIGRRILYPDIRLRCYRNECAEESPGNPITRLVIEGCLEGERYFWPIDINRGSGTENGIREGHRYTYDITITRKGSSDPDIPVESDDSIIRQEVSEWEEKERYEVIF